MTNKEVFEMNQDQIAQLKKEVFRLEALLGELHRENNKRFWDALAILENKKTTSIPA